MERERETFGGGEAWDPLAERLLTAFVRQYRHAAVGSLVKGIVHNLNGALQILSMRTELLQGALMKEENRLIPSVHQKAAQCLEQVQKMKTVIEVLIQKGVHDDEDSPQRIDVNELLEEQIGLLKHNLFFKHQGVLKRNLASHLPPLHGYYVDFSHGLSNVIQNAIEAIEESPTKELTLTTEKQDDQIEVRIGDTGNGLSEEVRRNLFKPFFTTKGKNHPGLGLFISKRVLAPYGASFQYDDQGGETTFRINFPV
jgi:signal transduction histidine kinase